MLALPVVNYGIRSDGLLASTTCGESAGKTGAKHSNSHRSWLLSDAKGPVMLRVETQELADAFICRLEGRFTGEGAEQVRLLLTRCNSKLGIIVDLTDVMFIDLLGEDVLSFVKKLGAKFAAETSYARDICERLQLPLANNHKQNSPVPANGDGRRHGPANNSRRP